MGESTMKDRAGLAAELLEAVHKADGAAKAAAFAALLEDSDALLGIRDPGLWAGRIEVLMGGLSQQQRGAIKRAGAALAREMKLNQAQPDHDPTAGVRAQIELILGDGRSVVPPTLERACVVLGEDPRWLDRVSRNELTDVTSIDQVPLDEDGVLDTARWLEREYGAEWPKDKVRDALLSVGASNRIHPIREYLATLPAWDEVERLPTLLVDYFGADVTDETDADPEVAQQQRAALFAEYGRCFMVAMVARALKPGEKVDHVLTLQGPQGWGKSSGLAALCRDRAWFSDDPVPFEDPKRLGMALRGKWMIEFGDFASVKRADVDTVKSFLTRDSDWYVPMYGRSPVEQPRTVGFVATVNDATFLLDAGRRWWVVPVRRRVDVARIAADRDQLWAEALHRHQARERWHLSAELEVRQREDVAKFAVRGVTAGLIEDWRASSGGPGEGDRFRMVDVWNIVHRFAGLVDCEGNVRAPTMGDQRDFGRALRDAGWTQAKKRGDTSARWYPPVQSPRKK